MKLIIRRSKSVKESLASFESKADWNRLATHLEAYNDIGAHAVDVFKKCKDRLKIEERDVYYWLKKDPEDFIHKMNELETTKSKTQSDKEARQSGYEKVAENDKWNVYKILTHKAAIQLGKGTKWCITMTDPHYWKFYLYEEESIFFFFIRKKPQKDKWDKIALQYTDECKLFWDATDKAHKYLNVNLSLPAKFDDFVDISDNLVEIPDTYYYDGKNKIDRHLTDFITNVIVEDGVTSIDKNAFYGCENLKNIIIPNSVTSIGDSAFSGCSELASMSLPNSITRIGDGAFWNCSSLKNITIPDSVTSIEKYAFYGCDNLVSVNLSKSLTSLEEYTFCGCDKLTNITIPNSVKNIGKFTFQACTDLKTITIPNTVAYVGQGAFFECDNLTVYCETGCNRDAWHFNWDGHGPQVVQL